MFSDPLPWRQVALLREGSLRVLSFATSAAAPFFFGFAMVTGRSPTERLYARPPACDVRVRALVPWSSATATGRSPAGARLARPLVCDVRDCALIFWSFAMATGRVTAVRHAMLFARGAARPV